VPLARTPLTGVRLHLVAPVVAVFRAGDGAPRDPHSFPTRRSSDLTGDHGDAVVVGAGEIAPVVPGDLPDLDHLVLPLSPGGLVRSEEHTSELQSRFDLVCRLLLAKKKPPCPTIPPARTHPTAHRQR